MKTLNKILFLWALLITFAACEYEQKLPNGYIETTLEGSSTFVLKGYESSSLGFTVLKAEGLTSPLYIQEKQFTGSAYHFLLGKEGKLTDMGELPGDEGWQTNVEVVQGKNYWARCNALSKYIYLKVRVAYIDGNNVGIEYINAGTKDRDLSKNANANLVIGDRVSVTSYEIPYLNPNNVYVDHYADVDGKQVLNFALEWNSTSTHSAWVAFSFDAVTIQEKVKRSNAWSVDPKLPKEMQVTEDYHKNDGFDKGHLCASADRLCSQEANEQTFYYSNISPMLADLNQGFWSVLEVQVRKWGQKIPSVYDKVYVTKGGTANNLLLGFTGTPVYDPPQTPKTDDKGFTVKGLGCPKYYYMAVLSEKGNTYHAIGFLIEHKEGFPKNPSAEQLRTYAMSIDELEAKTGIDFFCNLPDVIEDEVEHTYNANDWVW